MRGRETLKYEAESTRNDGSNVPVAVKSRACRDTEEPSRTTGDGCLSEHSRRRREHRLCP